MITEELPEFAVDSPLVRYLSERLSAGWYVVVLLADQRRVDAARRFDHPHYEEHLLVDFPPQAWGEKHSRFISGKKFQLLSHPSLCLSHYSADRASSARSSQSYAPEKRPEKRSQKRIVEMEAHLRSLGAQPADGLEGDEAAALIAHE